MSFNPELWVKRNSTYLTPSSDIGVLLPEDQYIAFGTLFGVNGYGFRDNGGIIEFKDAGGVWAKIGADDGQGVTVEIPTGDVNSSNSVYEVSAEPKWIVADSTTYFAGAGYSYTAPFITMDVPPSLYIRAII